MSLGRETFISVGSKKGRATIGLALRPRFRHNKPASMQAAARQSHGGDFGFFWSTVLARLPCQWIAWCGKQEERPS
jgi:hypothetical protein